MAKRFRWAKRIGSLSFWAVQIAGLYGQNIKTGPEVGQQVPAFSAPGQRTALPDSQIDSWAQRSHAGLFTFRGLVTVL
jgi:hypothetical protein